MKNSRVVELEAGAGFIRINQLEEVDKTAVTSERKDIDLLDAENSIHVVGEKPDSDKAHCNLQPRDSPGTMLSYL